MPKLEYVFYKFEIVDMAQRDGKHTECMCTFIYQAFEYQIKWNSLLKLIPSLSFFLMFVSSVKNENTSQWDNLLGI